MKRAALAILLLLLSAHLTIAQTPRTADAPPSDAEKRSAPKQQFVLEPPPPPPPRLLPPPPVLDLRLDIRPSLSDQNQTLLGRSPEAPPAPPAPAVLRAILGFVALLVLAYLAGQPRIQHLERRLNIAHLATAGLPFVLLGFLASQPAVGILTSSVLREIGPFLPLGLGWIGFTIGSRFDARSLDKLPRGTGPAVLVTTALPAAIILGICGLLLVGTRGPLATAGAPGALRDALLLATAGAMAARSAPHFLQAFSPGGAVSERLLRLIELEQLAGVFGLMMVSAYYRPQGVMVAWQLPGTAWLFITLGIGTTMGIVVFATLARINKGPQFTAALLGAIAFTAGMASFLRLSPVSVCFIAGAIVINLGGQWKERVCEVLERLERPVYFVFLVFAGAVWRPGEWQGWLLMAFFISSRFVSKWLSAELLGKWWIRDLAGGERRVLAAAPMGALSIAIVVSAQDLYSGPTVGWIVTAVIGGAIVMELVLQLAARRLGGDLIASPQPSTQTALEPGSALGSHRY
jgi:Kef-type K+ transport system membrane component KefB